MIMSAQFAVASHLSDAQFELSCAPARSNARMDFAKFIIFWCEGDLTQDINPHELWTKFAEQQPHHAEAFNA